MRIALTGSDGMLGHDIQRVFPDVELIPFTLADFDVTDLDKTVHAVREARPDLLIHPAAYTDVDGCEQNPDLALRVNGAGTRNVVMACEEAGCPIMYISTDYVFNGNGKEPYNEWDETEPVNKYGLSKLLGERFVQSLTNKFYIVRTSWLFGSNGRNFVDTIARMLFEKEEIRVVNDQFGCPTYTYDLAQKLRELAGKGYGTYHITNSGHCSWHEFALEIADLKRSNCRVVPVTSEEFKRPAKRPSWSVLGNTMLRHEGIRPAMHWREALREYLL